MSTRTVDREAHPSNPELVTWEYELRWPPHRRYRTRRYARALEKSERTGGHYELRRRECRRSRWERIYRQ